jgi:lipid-A-disaccharide synthase
VTIRVGMVAGEASGDLLGAHLIAALKARRRGLEFSGIGGARMAEQGFEVLHSMDKLGVRGYAEVLKQYREIRQVQKDLIRQFLEDPPALFIGIDSSDFNLDIERKLKDKGVRVVHYVSPAVWAWRGWRLKRIARSVSHILALFPFEPALYQEAGVPVTYVGHPLADMIPLEPNRAEARRALRLPLSQPIVALLPGSRKAELHYMADLFVKTAKTLVAEVPDAHFVAPMASRAMLDMFNLALRRHAALDLPLKLMFGHSHEALCAADVALVASGTATLETALFKTPMVITYRQSMLNSILMKRMIYLPYIGLPNILAEEQFVPEYVQNKATPDALAKALLGLLTSKDAREAQIERFRKIHLMLKKGTADIAAETVLKVLDAA